MFTVLFIDDDAETLAALETYFGRKGYRTVTAVNGLEALKIINNQKGPFDLIITDIVMPSVSGLAVISVVKKKSPDIPIIAVTGYGEHPETLATEAQADLVVKKPVDLAELEEAVIILLSRKMQSS